MTNAHEPVHIVMPADRCPRCEYDLAGLPDRGACPECGFSYGPDTIVLQGISRGASSLSRGRLFLLMLIALTLWLWPHAWMLAGWNGFAGAVLLTVAMVAFFIRTGRRQIRGFEPFVFCPQGFGPGAMLTINSPELPFTWDGINRVEIKPIGKTWQRVRIGAVTDDVTRLRSPLLDAGIRLDRAEIPTLEAMLQTFMDQAYASDADFVDDEASS